MLVLFEETVFEVPVEEEVVVVVEAESETGVEGDGVEDKVVVVEETAVTVFGCATTVSFFRGGVLVCTRSTVGVVVA
ncbi:hypothetical protein D3C80_2101200 [compost metagenome]